MATGLVNLLLGANFDKDDPFCDTLINHFKNHWRMSDPCANLTNIQPGMIVSDSDNEKLLHRQAAACKEILQADTPFGDDNQIMGGDNSDSILIPYEETINDAIIWGLPIDPKRGLIFCDVADVGGDFTGLITPTGFPEINLVDLDLDSRIRFGFTADDKPTILLQSGAYCALIQQSQAEGLAGADTRIGLDPSNRTIIICGRGDINTDFGLASQGNPTVAVINAAGTQMVRFDYDSWYATQAYIFNMAGSITFRSSGAVPALLFEAASNDIGSGNLFTFHSIANMELTDDNARQAWMYIEPKNLQTLTAAFDGIYLNLDTANLSYGDGSTGDGNNLLNLAIGAVSRFKSDIYGYVKAGISSGALADNDTFVTTIPDTWIGIVIVENVTDTTSGIYHFDGAALVVINQNANFTTTQGTNDKINVYIAANLLTVENTWAAAKTVKVFFIGT